MRQGWALGCCAVPPALLAGLVVFGHLFWGGVDHQEASCEEALAFAAARLPAGASDQDCESYGVMDRAYRGTFRMPRADVAAWVAASFPDRSGAADPGCAADLCVDVRRDPMAKTTKGAYGIGLEVTYEPGAGALVSFGAYDY
ncbi:hypothetical protein [Streptomyces sp. NPDC006446]|uniref:hypothetical protein n=1 Tax=Streptomyces sp. NPDC006446 TaxID=3154301 RepID=UPI0033B0CA89